MQWSTEQQALSLRASQEVSPRGCICQILQCKRLASPDTQHKVILLCRRIHRPSKAQDTWSSRMHGRRVNNTGATISKSEHAHQHLGKRHHSSGSK